MKFTLLRNGDLGCKVAFSIAILLLASQIALAQNTSVRLRWHPNQEPDLSHYLVYRDTVAGTMKLLDWVFATESHYVDKQAAIDRVYYYKLVAVDRAGNHSEPSSEVMAKAGEITVLREFRLEQNMPNPFRQDTWIEFRLQHSARVSIAIFDALGRRVRSLVSGKREAGPHLVLWDGTDDAGAPVATGVYYYQLITDEFRNTRRAMRLR